MTASFTTLNSDPVAGTAAPTGARLRQVFGTWTGSTSYTTGGDAVTAASLGLTNLLVMELTSPDNTGTWLPVWTGTKVKLFSALGTEVSSTTDVHTAVVPFVAIGY